MFLLKAGAGTLTVYMSQRDTKNWVYRDDIGAFWGIKGYEE